MATRRLETADVQARARRVRVIGFDVDGVATDNKLYYGPAGEALHAFSARDGLGLVRARMAGLVLVAVTGRASKNVEARLTELKVPFIRQGAQDKAAVLGAVLDEVGASWDEVAFIGDDVNDLPVLLRAGLSAAPADAVADVLPRVHVVMQARGGAGALRELVEVVMKAQGTWVLDGVDP